MRLSVYFLATISLWFHSCKVSTAPPKLVWADEFDYAGAPDSTHWNYELGNGCPANCGWGNNEVENYTNQPANVRAENGLLIIEALKSDSGWTSAKITSKGKGSFTYGKIEFRAKLPNGIGTWPALWMLGESIESKGWPICGEIDIMEHVGRNLGVVQSAMHTGSSFGDTVNKGSTTVSSVNSEFHTYAANWTADKIEFMVDGIIYYTYKPAIRDANTWPFDSPFYIIMNIAMGGNLGGHNIDPSLQVARMEVDYVRVYQ